MIKFFLLTLLTLSIATSVNASTAKIYVWVNESGELVYSDTPKPGAEEVKTKPGNVFKSSSNVDSQVLDIQKNKIEDNYQVVIDMPQNNATIRDNTGSITVRGSIKPIFKSGLKVQLILDDKPYMKAKTHAMFALKNIDRGEHQIKMQLLNEKGKVIALSKSITFYMHRASVN
jgi:hypothetical protein